MVGIKRKNRFEYDEADLDNFESMFLSLGDKENKPYIGHKTAKPTEPHSFSQNDTQIAKLKTKPYSALFCVIKSTSKLENETKLFLSIASQQHSDISAKREIPVVLSGEWTKLEFKTGQSCNLIVFGMVHSVFDKPLVINDDSKHFLVLHPEILLNCTSLSTSFSCIRKTVLSHISRTTGGMNKSGFLGCIVHEVFQTALKSHNFAASFIKTAIKSVIRQSYVELSSLNLNAKEVEAFILGFLPKIARWGPRYMRRAPLSTENVCLSEIVDIEELIWSPSFGLKGKVDALARVGFSPQTGSKGLVTPFEIKSGTDYSRASHQTQVALYNALVADKYGLNEFPEGLLFYLASGDLHIVQHRANDFKAMMLQRNKISGYLKNQKIPEMIDNTSECDRCYERSKCFVVKRSSDLTKSGADSEKELSERYQSQADLVHEDAANYIKKWKNITDLEENCEKETISEIWNLGSEERERLGRCYGRMSLVRAEKIAESEIYHFKRELRPNAGNKNNFAFLDGQKVVISAENGSVCLTTGVINKFEVRAEEERVSVYCLKPINCYFLERYGQFRLDFDEYTGSHSVLRHNIFSLFASEDSEQRQRNSNLIKKIIKSAEPSFDFEKGRSLLNSLPTELADDYKALNEEQQKAALSILSANDYSLLFGMPGTGKSTNLVFALRILSHLNKKVLVVSYTHSALDNLLIKLKQFGVNFVRIGTNRVDPELRENTIKTIVNRASSLFEFNSAIKSVNIFGTTCLSVNTPIISATFFDFCFIDEASQMTEPACIGPLKFAKTFVLVGDYFQLSPLVKSSRAASEGARVSLFERLCKEHPAAINELTLQYRMSADVMRLPNALFYNNNMKCATAAVSTAKLVFPGARTPLKTSLPPFLAAAIDPQKGILFISTDAANATEEFEGPKHSCFIVNKVEAAIIGKSVNEFIRRGLCRDEIAVLATYKSQTNYLERALKPLGVKVSTVDQFQGRDCDCVFISLVRANAEGETGDLVRDWRRLSVAMTRARKKVVIVGSVQTMGQGRLMGKMIDLVRGWGRVVVVGRDEIDF